MDSHIIFDEELIKRYDCSGPRYTSYPTAVQFSTACGEEDYREWANDSNQDPIPVPLSLYMHIPFCDTICYYCGCSKVVTRDSTRALPYVELLKKEIELQGALFARDRPVKQIHWGGGTPTFLEDRAIADLFATIRRNFSVPEGDKGEFAIEVDPRTVNRERIMNLREIGFNRISFGVQDFDHNVQKAVNREQTTEQILDVINAAREFGFHSINIDLMYGLPLQTLDSFEKTIQTTIKADPGRIAVYNYAHLPDMFKPQRRINQNDLPPPDEKLNILQMTIDNLQSAGYVYIGMDHFAKKSDDLATAQHEGTLHRNFQGYSTYADSDIVAMGITAISSICGNYSQNVRSIEEYKSCLDENKIPVFRGIELEPDDILRREIINQLMCNNRLDIAKLEQKWKIVFSNYFASAMPQLNNMAEDGLLTINSKAITITPTGRLLVRAICMEFDVYLQEREKQQRYSRVI